MTTRTIKSNRFRNDHLEQLNRLAATLKITRSDLLDEAIYDLLNKYKHLLEKEPRQEE
jgi:hypothetical protein